MHEVEVKGILSSKNGMNIYRGCMHGCIYCDSRSKCYGMEHDFCDIEIKKNAVELLEVTLKKKRTHCMIGTGSMTDPYIPIEAELKNMRKCLKIMEKYDFGATLITKSDLVLRDLDILKRINENTKCVVQMTLTTFDEMLCRKLEPTVCTTKKRFETLKAFRDNNIPTVVWLTPILPFINDTEENISGILDYCIEADVRGILFFGAGLTLREGSREYFYQKLDEHFPGIRQRYIKTYGNAYMLQSPNNQQICEIFYKKCRENGILCNNDRIFEYLNTYECKKKSAQISLFD